MGKGSDLIGQVFGKLTVVEFAMSKNGRRWLCKCACGGEKVVSSSHLIGGSVSSCGCLFGHKDIQKLGRGLDLTGQVFGKLTVVEIVRSNNGHYWLCKCSCGGEKVVSCSNLRNGAISSCGCLYNRLPNGEAAARAVFRSMIENAKRRKYLWNLTIEEFKLLTQQNCFYCGVEPAQNFTENRQLNGSYTYNGIDRIDSTKGYFIGNVVPCCKQCNTAKSNKTIEEFRNFINALYSRLLERKQEKENAQR